MPPDSIASVALVIFIAALPGRTTFLILLLASKSKALPIFLGSVLAFGVQSLISVLFGSLLGRLPHQWIALASGLIFLSFSFKLWRERNLVAEESTQNSTKPTAKFAVLIRDAFLSVFIAEWGDISQIAIASVSAQNANHIIVWIASALALALTALLAVSLGSRAHKFVSTTTIHRVSFFTFFAIGIYFLIKAFMSGQN